MANPYFNAAYYLATNLDVLAAGYTVETAEQHYLQYGAAEALSGANTARKPAPWFDIQFYLTSNPDLLANGIGADNAFWHFTTYGQFEQRSPANGLTVTDAKLKAYADANEDLRTAFGITDTANLTDAQKDALTSHFYQYGYAEDRAGSPFDTDTNPGETFTLTTNVDNIVGTSGDDVVGGVTTTFQAVDSIDGGGGFDTLKLALTAAYTGGASIKNIEELSLTQSTAGGFNAAAIAGLEKVSTNASTVDIGVTNLIAASDVSVSNQDTAVTVTYADSAVSGSADEVTLSLDNVAQAGGTAINLNNTTATTGATGIETLNVDLAGSAGANGNSVTINTNATASLKAVNVSGSAAGSLVMGTNLTTTATTINASATTGGVAISGLGTATHNVTLGAGNDSVDFGGNLTSADTAAGGAGNDTIATTAANLNTLNTAGTKLANVTEFETLRVTDDAGANATINAALVGAVNLRLATQTGAETVVVNNLGGDTHSANVRFDSGVTGVTLNIKDATLPSTADVLNLDVRGAGQTYTFTAQGVETVNVNASNATGTATLALTDAALTTLTLTNTGAANFVSGALGAGVSSVDLSGDTGSGTNTVTLSAAATTGATVTGSAGIDLITGSSLVDIINSGAGNDVITQSLGADRINVGTGTDTFVYADLGVNNTAITITAGTTIDTVAEGFNIITGMSAGDVVRLDASYTAVGAAAANTAVAAVAFNTTFADNASNLVRGNYAADTGLFTISASGSDSLFVTDVDDTVGTQDYSGIVLVGYATAATAAAQAVVGGAVELALIA